MKTLLIMRPAKSSWAEPGLQDFDRPLNDRGRRDAPRMGTWLKDQGLTPDVIISSTANRAKTTAEIVAEHSDYDRNIRFHEHLYHGAPRDYFRSTGPLSTTLQCCLLVGHNPGLEQLVENLTDCYETMPTAAVAVVECPIEDWALLEVERPFKLRDVWRPKEIF